VGLHPTSQMVHLVFVHALAELSRRQKAAIGRQKCQFAHLAARRRHTKRGSPALNRDKSEGRPGSIPTAPTNHPIC
jgi:hypothetical protein